MFRSMPPSKRSLLKISVGPDTPFRPLFARFQACRQDSAPDTHIRRRQEESTRQESSLCCRIMLMALCVTCSFAPAWAATFVAAKAARVPHGRKAACIHGRPACAFVRQSRPKAPLREPFLPLLAPLHAALPCGGGRPQSSLTLAPTAVKGAYFSLSSVNLNRVFSKQRRSSLSSAGGALILTA